MLSHHSGRLVTIGRTRNAECSLCYDERLLINIETLVFFLFTFCKSKTIAHRNGKATSPFDIAIV